MRTATAEPKTIARNNRFEHRGVPVEYDVLRIREGLFEVVVRYGGYGSSAPETMRFDCEKGVLRAAKAYAQRVVDNAIAQSELPGNRYFRVDYLPGYSQEQITGNVDKRIEVAGYWMDFENDRPVTVFRVPEGIGAEGEDALRDAVANADVKRDEPTADYEPVINLVTPFAYAALEGEPWNAGTLATRIQADRESIGA